MKQFMVILLFVRLLKKPFLTGILALCDLQWETHNNIMIKNLSTCHDELILTQVVEPSFRHGLPESRVQGCTHRYYIASNKIEYKNQLVDALRMPSMATGSRQSMPG